ncbi:MAG: chorismate synthase [Leptospiraceae bacterium]|nr:chorismate synthase [Leptospiraceae bacterium]
MPGSSTGTLFHITTFGESHGPAVGVVVDGCPAGLAIDWQQVQAQLDRRRPGQNRLTTQRKEADELEVLSGMFEGRSLGTPIAIVIRNKDNRSKDYQKWSQVYRPSHADYTTNIKYGYRTPHGGGRASARETIGRVAAGAIAEQILRQELGIEIVAWVDSVGTVEAGLMQNTPDSRAVVDQSLVRCPDEKVSAQMINKIEEIKKAGNSIGGTIGVVVRNVPPGLGEPVFDRLEAELAKAALNLPACKGFESGSGFAGSQQTARDHNDLYTFPQSAGLQSRELPTPPLNYNDIAAVQTKSNHSGGIQGGISNGMPITMRLAFKPTATIHHEQETVNEIGQSATILPGGRHDPCVLPRAVPIVEAMVSLVLVDALFKQRALYPEWWQRFQKNNVSRPR